MQLSEMLRDFAYEELSGCILEEILTAINSDDIEWITVKGNHIPIYEGQSKSQAIRSFFKNKSFKTQSQIIAGIKRGKPMSFKQANEGKVNPNYSKSLEYQNNCQTCILTFELRLRGFDIEAVPFDKNNPDMVKLAKQPWLVYQNTKVLQSTAKNFRKCEEWLKNNIKQGERYGFGYRPGMVTNKHVIIAQKTLLGKIEFYDPQNGNKLKVGDVLRDAYMYQRIGLNALHYQPILFKMDVKTLDKTIIDNIFK